MWPRFLRRRAASRERPFPPAWARVLDRVRVLRGVGAGERARVEAGTRAFVAEKGWEGCAGLRLTDEMKVVVGAHAALLALNLPDDAYWKVERVLFYPSTFVNPGARGDATGVHHQGMEQSGEAWHGRGPVVLSWADARRTLDPGPAAGNVVLHELAHKLDLLDGWADGEPRLHRPADLPAWREVMAAERAALARALSRGATTVLDPYAATDEAEFFAVATETFFERPGALREERPALYGALTGYFRQDPAARAAP